MSTQHHRGGGPTSRGTADLQRLANLRLRVNNWGRWGPDDELGTLNYVTQATVAHAATRVREGRVFSLAIPLDRTGPQVGHRHRFNPIHVMFETLTEEARPGGMTVADDMLILPLQSATQWDSLSHVADNGLIYGGRSATLVGTQGAKKNSIASISHRVCSRGVLLDIARWRGVDALPVGHVINAVDLEACASDAGVSIETGDVLLIRTGFLAQARRAGWAGFQDAAPGLSVWSLEWIHERQIAAVASDTAAVEVRPTEIEGVYNPFHSIAIVHMGLLLGEIFDLERLAQDCHENGQYEFLFVAAPLPVTGGVGSPVNPYALK